MIKIKVSRGTITFIDPDCSRVGVMDVMGNTINYLIRPANLLDTDGTLISIDELLPGDHVIIHETHHTVEIRVLKIA